MMLDSLHNLARLVMPALFDYLARCALLTLLGCALLATPAAAADPAPAELTLLPSQAQLRGSGSHQQLLLTGRVDGRQVDVTSQAQFRSATPDVVAVSKSGRVTPVGSGTGRIIAALAGEELTATFEVTSATEQVPLTFELDIQPILASYGCSTGACHGKQGGQNGFALSLLGFDHDFDYAATALEGRGRRVFPAAPDRSLLLRKATGAEPHGGGKRFEPDSPSYNTLLRWISTGMARSEENDPQLQRIEILPGDLVLGNDSQHALLVTAHYSDGSTRDVTEQTAFNSSENVIAKIGEDGVIHTGPLAGEAVIMARFMDQITTRNVLIPNRGQIPAEFYAGLPRYNFVDEHVWNKLQLVGVKPSAPCDDDTFLRRAYLDIIGRLPTPAEVRDFLADDSSQKRTRLVDELLQRPEYADFWANKWADLLRPNPYRVGIKSVLNYDKWIRDSFRQNKPYDQFVRELLTAQGTTWRNGAVNFFRERRTPDELTTIVSQLFLGIRLECAKCHHHPFEVWGQDDFYSFAAYFDSIGRKGRGLSPPISGSEEMVYVGPRRAVKHPRTDEEMSPRPLFGEAPQIGEGEDPRAALAAWITRDNPYFAQVMANRVWADMMGVGIVHPVDDIRATNPPSNAPLLEALGEEFAREGYDIKKLIRTIATSYVYGLSSEAGPSNLSDLRNYSRHYRQRLRAEVLLDAVSDVTGVPESFEAMPVESRAMEIWSHRVSSLFLDTFGRPDPNQDPPCERTGETAVVQALHLMNSPQLHDKVTSDSGWATKLADGEKSVEQIVEEIYLAVYARYPTADEISTAQRWYSREGKTRRQATEDYLWALMNTPEFVFKN